MLSTLRKRENAGSVDVETSKRKSSRRGFCYSLSTKLWYVFLKIGKCLVVVVDVGMVCRLIIKRAHLIFFCRMGKHFVFKEGSFVATDDIVRMYRADSSHFESDKENCDTSRIWIYGEAKAFVRRKLEKGEKIV